MIKSATGLKAHIRNMSGGEDKASKAYMRVFFMERFMERMAASKYQNQFILKGGMLVSSLLGIRVRTTMDIDTTVKALPLTEKDILIILNEICELDSDDNVSFSIMGIETIMDDFEYPGIRVYLEACLDRIKQPIKIDISTDDVITPKAVEYQYKLMFEDRYINLYSYNIETLLAEKIQTILSRGIANTRLRDFYDVYELVNNTSFSWDTLREAFDATCCKRETFFTYGQAEGVLNELSVDAGLKSLWPAFVKKNYYVGELEFEAVLTVLCDAVSRIISHGVNNS